MSNENLTLWNKVKQPPASALRQIGAGRLKGKTDINPQWRYQALTEHLGMCGIGWKYEIVRLWTEPAPENQVFVFAEIKLYIKIDGVWSEPIPGLGGHMMVAKESSGLHANDEGYKMSITDALSVALKVLGFGADIYAGRWDGFKYDETDEKKPEQKKPETVKQSTATGKVDLAPATLLTKINADRKQMGYTDEAMRDILKKRYKVDSSTQLTKAQAEELISAISKGKGVNDAGEWK